MNLLEPLAIAGIFLVSFIIIRKRFEVAIFLLLILSVLLHKELFSFYIWDLLPARIFMFALFCSFVLEILTNIFTVKGRSVIKEKYLTNTPAIILLLMLIINSVSIYFSLNLKASILLLGFFTTAIVMFVKLVETSSKSGEVALKYSKFYILLAFLLSLFGYFQYYLYATTGKIVGALWNIPGNIPRVGAAFWDVNHYAAFLAALLPISSVLVLTEKKLMSKVFYFVVSSSLLVNLILTNSRTAWIMAVVSLLTFCVLFLMRRFGRRGVLIVLLPIIVATVAFSVGYSQKNSLFRAKIKQYFHYRLDSFDSHIMLLTGTFQIFQQYPILGGGYGGFFEHFSKTKIAPVFFGRDPAAFNTRVPAHTIWGELLSGTGLMGFGVFMFFSILVAGTMFYCAKRAYELQDRSVYLISLAMGSVTVGWLVAGIFYSYNAEFFWIILALFFGYATANSGSKGYYHDVLGFIFRSGFAKTVVLGSTALLIFWGLGVNHLIPWDEAIYAKVAKNMVWQGEYISQNWKLGTIWYEKPPLYMWTEALLMGLFGFNSWVVRIPSALAGFLTVFLVYKISKKLFSKTAAYIAALCLVTTTHFLYYSRTGMLDVMVTLFITMSVYFYLASKESGKNFHFLLTGASIGLAVMTKGIVGLLPLFLIMLLEVFSQPRVKIKNIIVILAGLFIIAAPWHIEMYRRYGGAFLDNYIGYHVVDRARNAIEDKGNPVWWYLIVIKVSMRIWAIALLMSVPFAIYSVVRGSKKIVPFLIWFAIILALFSAAQSKLVWYIIPIYPAAAILNGYFLDIAINRFVSNFGTKGYIVLKYIILYVLTVFVFGYFALNGNLVFTSDLTGSQSRLMEKKEEVLGSKDKVYLDRIELPLALYYLNGPFEVVDFSAKSYDRVPKVSDSEKLILLTKKGRFSEQVPGYFYPPAIVEEDGDWILWYMPAKNEVLTF